MAKVASRSFVRFKGTTTIQRKLLPSYPIYMVSIPITTKHSYIYSKYTKEVIPGGKKSFETKCTDKCTEWWHKLEKSPRSLNQKIVSWTKRWIRSIPWIETSLRSIPSKKQILRFTRDDSRGVSSKQISKQHLEADELKPIPLLYPDQLMDTGKIREQLAPDLPLLYQRHKQLMFRDVALLPLTIPIIIVPIIPNVPGFYLVYRAYCHWRVMTGIDHLKYLLLDGNHFESVPVEALTDAYYSSKDEEVKNNVKEYTQCGSEPETLLLSEDKVPEICGMLGINELKDELYIAIEQERKRLKNGDPEFPWMNNKTSK